MRPFESVLSSQMSEYLAYRQGLGYALEPVRAHILMFDRYLGQSRLDWSSFTPAFFLEMTARLHVESRTVNRIVSTLRVFFRFLVRRGQLQRARAAQPSHSFAVNTLLRVKDRGESAQNALPVLAVYMGHSDYKHTSVYLRVADAAARQNLLDFALWQKRKT